MNCHDVREHFSAPVRGGTGLTERALVHAHVAQCAECQAARASLQLVPGIRQGAESSRAPVAASALRVAARAAEATRVHDIPSLTASGRSIEAVWTLPMTLFGPPARGAAHLVGRARRVSAGVPDLLVGLGSALVMAGRGTARGARELAVAAFAVLGGLGVLVSRALGQAVAVAARGITAARVEGLRIRDGLVRAGGRLPSLLAPPARAVGHILGTIPVRARAHPMVCAGIAVLVVLTSIVALGPRQWPDHLAPWFSPGERRDVRLPVDPKPAEPIAPAPLAEVAPLRPAAGPQPIPTAPILTPRVAAPETHAAIPAPVRRSPEPAAAEPASSSDPSDSTAAIDWLLKASGRRNGERP